MVECLVATTCQTPTGTWKLLVHTNGDWEFKFKPIDQLEELRASGSVRDSLAEGRISSISGVPLQELKYLLRTLQLLCKE